MGFLKDFLGGFSEGYIKERGIDGTLEDLGDAAKRVKGWFSENDDSPEDEDDPIAEGYNELIEKDDYQGAIDFIRECYKGEEKDYVYHFYIGKAYYHMGEYGKAINFLQQSYSRCPKNTDDANMIKEELDNAKYQDEYGKAWGTLLTDLEELRENNQCDEAIRQLDNFYNKYDDGQKDFYYWSQIFEIHKKQEIKKEDLYAKNDRNLQFDLNKMRELAKDGNYETLNSKEEALNHFNYAIKVRKLSEKQQFDVVKIEIEKYYSDSNKEINEFYWSNLIDNYIKALESDVVVGNSREDDIDNAIKALNQYSRIVKTLEDEEIRQILEEEVIILKQQLDNFKNNKPSVASDMERSSQEKENESTTDNEIEYKNEILACLADDGEITERERRLLDKLRKSLGISEDRAMQIEAECKNNGMTENEMEYLEELKACLADGMISDKEERLLQRLRKSLGISEERGIEIRNMIK